MTNPVKVSWLWIVQQHNIPYPATARVAGTTRELFGSRYKDESEASLLMKIATGIEDKIVFPSTSAGPDIWYHGKISENNDHFAVVSIQSKCHKDPLNFAAFQAALNSLMFSLKNTLSVNKDDWMRLSSQLGTMPYFRCVFSAAGFCEAVYYLVNEYDAIHENKIFIIWMMLKENLTNYIHHFIQPFLELNISQM